MKCTFGCKNYGKCGTCPPNTPSVADCRDFFRGYKTGVVFHFTKCVDKPEDRFAWTRQVNRKLLELEREVFLSRILQRPSFCLWIHVISVNHVLESEKNVKIRKQARPTPESMAVDVFETVRKIGYPIGVLYDYSQEMNRYAFLFIE